MMPRMVFARGYCREGCTACGAACPSGAIRPFTVEKKKKLAVGLAVFVRSDCLVEKEGLTCGNCVAHCPYTAIEMKAGDDKRKYPAVDAAKCVGCGSCECHCPVKAVRVQRRPPQNVEKPGSTNHKVDGGVTAVVTAPHRQQSGHGISSGLPGGSEVKEGLVRPWR